MKSKKILLGVLNSFADENGKASVVFEGKTYHLSPENAETFRALWKRLEYDDLLFDATSMQVKYRKEKRKANSDHFGRGEKDVPYPVLMQIAQPFIKKYPQFNMETTCNIMMAYNGFDMAFEDLKKAIEGEES